MLWPRTLWGPSQDPDHYPHPVSIIRYSVRSFTENSMFNGHMKLHNCPLICILGWDPIFWTAFFNTSIVNPHVKPCDLFLHISTNLVFPPSILYSLSLNSQFWIIFCLSKVHIHVGNQNIGSTSNDLWECWYIWFTTRMLLDKSGREFLHEGDGTSYLQQFY